MHYGQRRIEITSRIQTEIDGIDDLTEFKEWLKWDADDTSEDDTMFTNLIAATKQAELFTRRALVKSTWRSFIDFFPSRLKLDVHPIALTTIVVKYYDTNNVPQTLAATEYFVKDNGPDAYAEIIFDGTMPQLYDRWEPIYLEYNAGYESDELPEPIKSGILKMATDYTEGRSNEVQSAVNQMTYGSLQLWYPYKMIS